VAIKDSSGDVPFMMGMIDAVQPERPDFSFLTGWDACLLPMLQLGCHGGTNATSGVAPELTRKLFDLARAGRFDEARDVQRHITRLFDALFSAADFPEGFRLGVRARGVAVGPGRTPRAAAALANDPVTLRTLGDLLADTPLS
jgi:4-hydroxy-tetrahydrodipicolinate synthase